MRSLSSYAILSLLLDGAQHGYTLKLAHDKAFPMAKPIAFGQVYATLARLQRDGLIAEASKEREGGPDRTVYDLTNRGRSALNDWLSSIQNPRDSAPSLLSTKTTIGLLAAIPKDLIVNLVAQRTEHLKQLERLSQLANRFDLEFNSSIAIDYCIAHIKVDIEWLDRQIERLQKRFPDADS